MEALYSVGQRVLVNIGGCLENRSEGVITSIRFRPELTVYEVAFIPYLTDGRIPVAYMAQDLTPV
jgi:hypothetical protein